MGNGSLMGDVRTFSNLVDNLECKYAIIINPNFLARDLQSPQRAEV